MGDAAIHVVDRGSSISAILWCLWWRGRWRTSPRVGQSAFCQGWQLCVKNALSLGWIITS